MKLSIIDMRAVLRERAALMTSKKASEDPVDLMAGVADVQSILDEIKKYALELVATKEQLKDEAKADKNVSR